jgi:hypothetical protein
MCKCIFFVLAMTVLVGVDASAQGTYVSAFVFGDIVRSSHSESPLGPDTPGGGGEALGFAVRLGTSIGAAWGVEAEFARPAEFEERTEFPFARAEMLSPTIPLLPTVTPALPDFSIITPFSFAIRTSHRNTTLTAAVWVQQQLTARFALAYTGGVSFHRSEREYETTYVPPVLTRPILIAPVRTESTIYGARPMAGIESRVSVAEHVQVVGGIRLHGGENAWLIRPSAGIGWVF